MIKTNFSTYGQIIYDTKTDSVHSVEFLSRPKDGIDIDIERYFKTIDDESLMKWFNHQIGEAIDFYKKTSIEPHVNIDLDIFEKITELDAWDYEDYDSQFTLEITQVRGLPSVEILNQLKDPINFPSKWPWKGIRVALDDYDMNNIYHTDLDGYNFDMIKIDKSLVHAAIMSKDVYDHLIELRRKHDCEFVVEGVETIYQVEMLQRMGFHLFQGYFFHKPEPLETLIENIKRGT